VGGVEGVLGVPQYQASYSGPPAYREPAPRPVHHHMKVRDHSR
jgi:hypothetical protein